MELKFRDLTAKEVDVRVDQIKDGYCTLLLYKDSRVDMAMLDGAVGAMNWQRRHNRDNKNCEIGIYDSDKKEWVWKEDTGTESYAEAEKGLASDSFKRAGTNWGIGRELYTRINITVRCETEKNDKGKMAIKNLCRFEVSGIDIKNKTIVGLVITAYNKSTKQVETVFSYGTLKGNEEPKPEVKKEKPFLMSVEEAKRIEFEANGKAYTVGEMSTEQLLYLRDKAKIKDERLKQAVSLMLMEKARNGN